MGVPTIAFEMSGPLRVAVLAGDWTLTGLEGRLDALRAQLAAAETSEIETWNLAAVSRLDSLGASVLWRGWGDRLPERLEADPRTRRMLESAAALGVRRRAGARQSRTGDSVVALGRVGIALWRQLVGMIALTGQMLFDLAAALRRPRDAPLRELSANLYKTGVTALPITALVGFLIGVVLSYLSALQLKTFGADVFIINILGIGIVRELGPVLVAVLVAGRSGSAMTAQLGVMRVTEEIDALTTMGVPATLRLVLPKVLALLAAMPLLVLWTDAMALLGGMLAAQMQLGVSAQWFLQSLPDAISLTNYWIGILKGVTFGMLIALIACHFGLRIQTNTESLGRGTTTSVVTSITGVILLDALYAVIFSSVGI